jgi:AmmeMemoRadiSam system protein B
MSVKKRILPPGWYPQTEEETRDTLRKWEENPLRESVAGYAGIAPHAGWMFSGDLAFNVVRCLKETVSTVVVVGGHLPPSGGLLASPEDAYETPLGNLEADLELLAEVKKHIHLDNDVFADNTVEVQLPFIKYCFPEARTLGLRAEPSSNAVDLGQALFEASETLGEEIGVIGSTDLTHYGQAYGFTPKGSAGDAYQWVTEVNDKSVIDALLKFDFQAAIDSGVHNKAACSVGGAVAAAAYAKAKGSTKGVLLQYETSQRVYQGDSFVGYASIIYSES